MESVWTRAAGVLIVLLLLSGCEGTFGKYSSGNRSNQLHEAVLEYNKYVRWQEWEKASDYIKTDEQSAFKQQLEELEEDLRITDFEIRDTDVDSDAKTATARILYRYYWLPSITEKKMRFSQKWVWSEEEKRWAVDGPLNFLISPRKPERSLGKSALSSQAGETR
jgi:hypothetical protein